MKVSSVLIWRRPDCSYKGNTRLETSKIRCQVIKDETNLRQLLPEDQLPTSCGGRTSHDQIEWVEFYKELEPLLSASHACGRRLAAAMADLRATEGAPTRRQLHHQHRALARALADPELHRLRREGIGALGRLQERAHWLPASEDVRLGTERARQVFTEVDRAARRLEQLSEGRREKLRELARVRALEDESTQKEKRDSSSNKTQGRMLRHLQRMLLNGEHDYHGRLPHTSGNKVPTGDLSYVVRGRACFVPIVTYAADTWTLNVRETRKVKVVGMKSVRSMLAVTRTNRIRNEVIGGKSGAT
uniref:Uncharacterized protein n=1 Tax=Timema douglasi TaxID=61478 RepID=A0A7R8VQ87_TIMDO|nr:unnamed protein product [Timema douglasi]